jgi:hypothetical protein
MNYVFLEDYVTLKLTQMLLVLLLDHKIPESEFSRPIEHLMYLGLVTFHINFLHIWWVATNTRLHHIFVEICELIIPQPHLAVILVFNSPQRQPEWNLMIILIFLFLLIRLMVHLTVHLWNNLLGGFLVGITATSLDGHTTLGVHRVFRIIFWKCLGKHAIFNNHGCAKI